MSRTTLPHWLLPALAAPAALLLAGCGAHYTPSPHMADAPTAQVAATPNAATLVFVRPSVYGGVLNPSIFIDGQYVGDVEAQRQVAVTVAPGEHVVVGGIHDFMTKACHQLVARVEPGKIYYVETTVAMGADLFATRAKDAPKLREWLDRAPIGRRMVDPRSPMDASEQQECMQKAAEHLADDDATDKAKHTLEASDGFATAQ